MSETVKLIIEISEERYNGAMRKAKYTRVTGIDAVLAKGIPLDDVKAEIEKLPDLNPDYPMDKTIHISKWNVMQILDNIGKGDKE